MKHIKLNTITKKSGLLIIGIGLAMAAALWSVTPFFFYQLMKPHISSYVTGLMHANTIAQSYIWRSNSTVFQLYQNEQVHHEIFQYFTSEDPHEKSDLKTQILEALKTNEVGTAAHQVAGEGALYATSYYMVYSEGQEPIYWDEAEEIASLILESGWLSTITTDMDMIYSPVLSDGQLQAICFVIPFSADGIPCFGVHMMDFSHILGLFQDLEDIGIQDFCLFQDDRILYENSDYHFDLASYPGYMFTQLQYETSIWDQSNAMDFVTLCSYEGENLKIGVHADRQTLLSPYRSVILLMGWFLSGIIFLLAVLIILMLRHLLGRLTVLNQRIDRVIEGNYSPLPEDRHRDEIGNMTKNFNLMLQTIRDDMDQKIEREKKEQQMQYSLLVSAIDPHFIYNTLNTITFLAHMKKTEEIASVNSALIGTLKDRLAIKNLKVYDSLQTEQEVLGQYMLIQSYLCHNTIDYHFEAAQEDLSLLIPKNILQPLVENSIKHGLLCHKDPVTHRLIDGIITVKAVRSGPNLTVTVTDNGAGISPESICSYFELPLEDIPDTPVAEHIGIYNIRKRLHYLYQDQFSLTAKNLPGCGCIVTLTLPVMREGDLG